jgi:hypothetical protein
MRAFPAVIITMRKKKKTWNNEQKEGVNKVP